MASKRLVSRAELSRRVSVGKSYVCRCCRPGGKLHAAMVGDKVDLDHKNARQFCLDYNYEEPNVMEAVLAERQKAKPQRYEYVPADKMPSVPAPDEYDDEDPTDATEYMNMTLRGLVYRYGKQGQFKDYVSAYKMLVTTQASEEKMARERKEFAHWSHFERLAMHIDGLQKMLMGDAAKNIATTCATLSAAGASDAEIRKAVTKTLESTIKIAKSQAERIIRNAKQ